MNKQETRQNALAALRKEYEYTRPRPTAQGFPLLQRVSLMIVLVAAIVMSASHTIPTFAHYSGLEGHLAQAVSVASFLMLEVGLVVLGYQRIKRANHTPDIQRNLAAGTVILIITALGGNLHATLETVLAGSKAWYILDTTMGFVVGVSPVAMTYLVGEITAVVQISHDNEQTTLIQAWVTDFESWATPAKITATMKRLNGGNRDGQPRVTATVNRELATTANNRDGQPYMEYSRSDKRLAVIRYIQDNPQKVGLSNVNLAKVITEDTGIPVKRTLVGEVKNEMEYQNER